MAKRKKHILTLEAEEEFEMIGICSHHSDYRLAWGLNTKTSLHLTKCKLPYEVTNRKGEVTSIHSKYEFIDEDNRLEYYMIKNKVKGQFLIPEKPTIDYFLFLCNNNVIDVKELIKELKMVSSILGAYVFFPEEITSSENLVFN
ncbi:MAG: IPExxxVDY family protein [Crocinitomicaceae bacterium]|nr:IPExxxVDY family protein [Crocinitomicaceae bacterium]MDG1776745.1 IPExxxVDY family protein [Crocinitomicaceae bacterium]